MVSAAPKTLPDASRVWVCECEKCGTVIEMSDAELSASPPVAVRVRRKFDFDTPESAEPIIYLTG